MIYKWCVFFISIVGQPGQKESLLLELLLLLFFEAILVSKAHSHLQMDHVHIPRLISGFPGETCLPNWDMDHLPKWTSCLGWFSNPSLSPHLWWLIVRSPSFVQIWSRHTSYTLILILCLRYVWLQQSGNNIIVATSAGMIDTGLKLNSDIEQNKRMVNHVHQTSCQHLGCEVFGVSCGLSWMLMQTIIFWVVWWANDFVWLKFNTV